MTPEDVLFVLNGLEPVDLTGYQFAVAVAPADMYFNYTKQAIVEGESWAPFARGEIVVVNSDGREPFGDGRHCRKWGIEFAYFDDLDDALTCAANVPPTSAPEATR